MEQTFSRTYKFAGHVVRVTTSTRRFHRLSWEYFTKEEPEFAIIIRPEDVEAEREKARQEDLLEGIPPREHRKGELEFTAVYRKLTDWLVEHGIILMHGSVIAVDGQAYLFTAKSGTGKSTHTRLWREYFGDRAVMVNDDKPLLELSETGVTVYGTPWNGKHHLGCNMAAPLKALCILERGEKNSVEKISAAGAYSLLLQQSNRAVGAEKMLLTLDLLEKIMGRVPIYRLKCNMEPEAAKVAYEGMQE